MLEITERSDARLSQVVADATRLRSLGFRLALDDVGAGNAGLEMLRELPVDFVKIDQSVIAAALEDAHAQAVLLAIIAYAGRAGAYVIAEGIESEQILSFVHNADDLHMANGAAIKGGQGYLLGRPSLQISRLIARPQVKDHSLAIRPVVPAARPRARLPRPKDRRMTRDEPFAERQVRAAVDESACRDENERSRGAERRRGAHGVHLRVHAGCAALVPLTSGEYEAVRSVPTHFLAAPGHLIVGVEVVVSETSRYRPGAAGHGTRAARSGNARGLDSSAGNWPMTLKITGLPQLPQDKYYEVYLVRDGKTWGSCGAFRVTRSRSSDVVKVTLTAPYALRKGDSWVVTRPGRGGAEPGRTVLRPVTA